MPALDTTTQKQVTKSNFLHHLKTTKQCGSATKQQCTQYKYTVHINNTMPCNKYNITQLHLHVSRQGLVSAQSPENSSKNTGKLCCCSHVMQGKTHQQEAVFAFILPQLPLEDWLGVRLSLWRAGKLDQWLCSGRSQGGRGLEVTF